MKVFSQEDMHISNGRSTQPSWHILRHAYYLGYTHSASCRGSELFCTDSQTHTSSRIFIPPYIHTSSPHPATHTWSLHKNSIYRIYSTMCQPPHWTLYLYYLFILITTLWGKYYFIDEAQRGLDTCPKSQSWCILAFGYRIWTTSFHCPVTDMDNYSHP